MGENCFNFPKIFQKTLKNTKVRILYPKTYDEHTYHFTAEVKIKVVKIKVVVGIAEAVDRAVIEKIKTLQCFKKSADGGQGEICHR